MSTEKASSTRPYRAILMYQDGSRGWVIRNYDISVTTVATWMLDQLAGLPDQAERIEVFIVHETAQQAAFHGKGALTDIARELNAFADAPPPSPEVDDFLEGINACPISYGEECEVCQ